MCIKIYATDLRTENSLQGEIGLEHALHTRGLQFCCIDLYAHATMLSAQIAEWYVHKDLCNMIPSDSFEREALLLFR